MQVRLRILRGSSAGKEIGLKGPKFLIGRSEECQMRARSDAISRRHCAIFVRKTGLAVRDLGSRNGTFVNGTRIDGDHQLADGDVLQVGPLEFAIVMQVPAEAKESLSAAKSQPERVGDLVSQWLDELDEPGPAEPESAGQRDTGRFYTDDTDQVTVDPTGEISTDPAEETKIVGRDPNDTDKGSRPGKNKPGKLPKIEGRADAPKNTQEAAAQMLRKMWNRR
jgi:pSer/pThr/pTyr-binding forkhead associated (FHA) protein